MKIISTRDLLKIANLIWMLIAISNFIFKYMDETKQQHTIVIWLLFLVASIIYNKLDDIEKKL
jgi:hypothetical protein